MATDPTNSARDVRQRSSTPFSNARESPTVEVANTEKPESDAIDATTTVLPTKEHAKKARVGKKTPTRRELFSSEGNASSSTNNSAKSGIKLDLRTGKKRKSSSEVDEKDGDEESAPTAKRAKTTKRRNNASSRAPTPPPIALPEPLPAPLAPAVGHAVTAMRKFAFQTYRATDSCLFRDSTNRNHISLSTTTLVSAVSRLLRYWQVGDPSSASISDVSDAIVRYFDSEYPVGVVQCVVIDVSTRTALEERIHAKIRGHGPEWVRLLEMELEMAGQELETQLGLNWYATEGVQLDFNSQATEGSLGLYRRTTEEGFLGRVRGMWNDGVEGEADVATSELATASADEDEAVTGAQLRRMLDARFYSRAGVSGAELEKLLNEPAALEDAAGFPVATSNASEETAALPGMIGNDHAPSDATESHNPSGTKAKTPPLRGPAGLPPDDTHSSSQSQHREDSVQSPESEYRPGAFALSAAEERKDGLMIEDEEQFGGLLDLAEF
ncbi:hypothetical protein BDY17DRAFT_304965 [Neohortaea acidophila]|uniref:Uncharacterized protein n=1 Tax=Neohortaea acidophila TaxID=245834 RepID=A0A6A6PGI9_9PEZI|nr:uncharacterized protein BDY17DRAFT_304965 [Neohortaea acidophila]KAF2479092.1 hypothetical protein BDY17DRAFT_304965 [Neohortaea acidophila]